MPRVRQWMVGIVINTGGVDVGDPLAKAPFAGANVLQETRRLMEVIEALDDVLIQIAAGPLTEAHANRATHPEAKSKDHVEVVMRHLVLLAIGGSCSEKTEQLNPRSVSHPRKCA